MILHKVVITWLLMVLFAPVMVAQNSLEHSREIVVNGLPMMSNVVVVQLSTDVDIYNPASAIPEGFSLCGRMLDPNQTIYFRSSSPLARTSQNVDLYDAEQRLVRVVYVKYTEDVDPVRMAARLKKYPSIAHAEPWYVAQVQGAPNDPLFVQQSALSVIRMQQAWDIEPGKTSVVVAISDNGVLQQHEDIQGNLYQNTAEIPNNNVDDDNNGVIDDYVGANFTASEDGTPHGETRNNRADGHGTKVAGIAAAATNNGIGMSGAAGQSKMFPLKTARVTGGGIVYGYQSLVYAANMGFDVVNASWGLNKPASIIDQAVIDYCLAKGTVVVASGGNDGNGSGGDGWALLNFPSAYDGVIGVGETTSSDRVEATSGVGVNCIVMAPGHRAIATQAAGGYSSSGVEGTSFAAPLVAGVAALLVAKYPELTPRQIAAQIRTTGDDISSLNPQYSEVLKTRVNAERALGTAPMSHPALRIVEQRLLTTSGTVATRYGTGDTLDIEFVVVNDLGPTTACAFELEEIERNGGRIQVLGAGVTTGVIATNQTVTVGPFRCVLEQIADRPITLGLQCADDNAYAETLITNLFPSSGMSVMQNNALAYSIGDDGTFGFNSGLDTRQGIGFNWKPQEWLLSPSGFLFSEDNSNVLQGFNNLTNTSDFDVEKSFVGPNSNVGVMSDASKAPNERVGVRITQQCTFPSSNSTVAVITVTIENTSGELLRDVAAGYYFDWDLGYIGENNATRLYPEALPVDAVAAAQLFEREGYPVSIICAAVSSEQGAVPQSVGMGLFDIVDDGDGLTKNDVVMLLRSGTSIQTSTTGDRCGLVGMQFPGELAPNDTRTFMVIISVGKTAAEAAAGVRNEIMSPTSVEDTEEFAARVFPNPTSDVVTIVHSTTVNEIVLVNSIGEVITAEQLGASPVSTQLDVSSVSAGSYRVLLKTNSGIVALPVAVVR